jgi:hypothetical protein
MPPQGGFFTPGYLMQLVPNWRQWPHWWSVRLQLAGTALLAAFEVFPDAIVSIWIALPSDVRAVVDPDFIRYVGYVVIVAGIIARVIKQPKLHEK